MNENSNTIKLYLIKVQKHGFNAGIDIGNIDIKQLDNDAVVNENISKIFEELSKQAYIQTKEEFGSEDPEKIIKDFNNNIQKTISNNKKFLQEVASAQKLIRALRSSGKNASNLQGAISNQAKALSQVNDSFKLISDKRVASLGMVDSIVKVAKGEPVSEEMAAKLGSKGGITSFQGDLFEAILAKHLNPTALTDPEAMARASIGANSNGISDTFTRWTQKGNTVDIGVTVKAYLSGAKEYKVADTFPFSSLMQFASAYSTLLKLNYFLRTSRKTEIKSNLRALIGAIVSDYAFRRGGEDWALYSINLTAINKNTDKEAVKAEAEFIYEKYKKYEKVIKPVRATVSFASGAVSQEARATKELAAQKYTVYGKF